MRFIFAALLFLLVTACSKESEQGNNPPQIKFISLIPSEIKNGGNDTIKIGFEFFDQDGDVGSEGGFGQLPNIFIRQTYDTTPGEGFLPVIPEQFKDPVNGIRGTAMVSIPSIFFPLDSAHLQTGDTFHFMITIKDRAGNESNEIVTPDIYILP